MLGTQTYTHYTKCSATAVSPDSDKTTTTYTGDTDTTTDEENTDSTESSPTVVVRDSLSSDSTLPIALSVSVMGNMMVVILVAVVTVVAVVVVKRRQRKHQDRSYNVTFRAEGGGSSNIINPSNHDQTTPNGVTSVIVRLVYKCNDQCDLPFN